MGRPKGSGLKAFCCRGHSIAQFGRNAAYMCRECYRIDHRRKYTPRRMLPSAPLRSLVTLEQATLAWQGYRTTTLNTAQKAAARLFAHDQISVDCADRWCIAIGSHLCLVYPHLYATEEVA